MRWSKMVAVLIKGSVVYMEYESWEGKKKKRWLPIICLEQLGEDSGAITEGGNTKCELRLSSRTEDEMNSVWD